MRRLCIIPARGGSKRIPRKNIKPFAGRPVIEYAISTAFQSGLFDTIMVSTDDSEIAEIARKSEATIPFYRTPKAADDKATTAEVIVDVLRMYQEIGEQYDEVCCIYPVTPLLRTERLREGNERLSKGHATVLPVVRYSTPIMRSLHVSENGLATFNWPEHLLTRSQDLAPAYYDAGQFYWLNVPAFLVEPKLVGSNTGVIILPEIETQDIDNQEDWEMAELKFRMQKNRESKI